MKEMTIDQFTAEVGAQGVGSREDFAFVCPVCATVQSARSLIAAGAGADFEAVEEYLGFSCVGRFTGAPAPRSVPDGQPCNWTLGGLFRLHKLEVVTPDGVRHAHFELATPEQAQRLAASLAEGSAS